MRLKICDNYLICKVANKCLNVREWVGVVEWNKDGRLYSSAVLWVISVGERKSWQKKKTLSVSVLKILTGNEFLGVWKINADNRISYFLVFEKISYVWPLRSDEKICLVVTCCLGSDLQKKLINSFPFKFF